MAFTFRMQLFAIIVLTTLLSQVIGHSYVTSPTSRSNQAQSETGCRGPACLGPCDVPLASATRAPIVAARGSSITVNWPRNNHAGGFIRFAWAPTANSDSASAFDMNVQQINCHEVGGCGPSDPTNPNGGDNGPADGSSMACSTTLTVPLSLTDGLWTLQWAWFGGAFALGDYYSCVDYHISGGAAGVSTPRFLGGDYTYPGQQKCKFFNTNELHVCVDEPCNAPIFPASQEESGVPANGQLGAGIPILSSSPSTSAAAVVAPQTTGMAAPATTGMAAPATTGMAAPATTGRTAPATTGRVVAPIRTTTGQAAPSTTAAAYVAPVAPSTTAASTPTVSAPQACALGNMICVGSSQYQTCTNGREANFWAAPQSCPTGLVCSPSGNYIYCLRP